MWILVNYMPSLGDYLLFKKTICFRFYCITNLYINLTFLASSLLDSIEAVSEFSFISVLGFYKNCLLK